MAVTRRVLVSLDCAEPAPLAAFWAAMLDGEVVFATPTTVIVRSRPIWLTALQVSDYCPPTWPAGDVPKQVHLDLAVTDLDGAVAEAERLGGRLAPYQPASDRWRVLFDPAGHPFCVTNQIPDRAQ